MSSKLINKKLLIVSGVVVFMIAGTAVGMIVTTNKSEEPQDSSSTESTPTQLEDTQKQTSLEKEDKSTDSQPKETNPVASTPKPTLTPEATPKDKNKLTLKDIPKDLFGWAEYHAFKRRIEVGKHDPIKDKAVGYLFANTYCKQHSSPTIPSKYAILCITSGARGHMAFVEKVSSDGSIRVSEMNAQGWNVISERTIPKMQASTYRYIP